MVGVSIGIGMGLSLRSSGPSDSPELKAFLAAMTVQPSPARKAVYAKLINSLKASGVWAKLDWLNLMAAHDEQAGRINAVNPAQVAVAANSPVFTVDRGFTGDGVAAYLDTGMGTPEIVKATRDSIHAGRWCSFTEPAVTNDAGRNLSRTPAITNTSVQAVINNATVTLLVVLEPKGHSVALRRNSTELEVYKDGAIVLGPQASASLAMSGGNFLILAFSSGTTPFPATGFSVRTLGAAHFGAGLTAADNTAFTAALTAYMTAVGNV